MNPQLHEALATYAEPGIEVTVDTRLAAELGMTSFDLIQLVGELEESLGIGIDVEQLTGVVTVGDLDTIVSGGQETQRTRE